MKYKVWLYAPGASFPMDQPEEFDDVWAEGSFLICQNRGPTGAVEQEVIWPASRIIRAEGVKEE